MSIITQGFGVSGKTIVLQGYGSPSASVGGLEPALESQLLSNGDLAAIVGAHIYPLAIPQQIVLPAVVYAVSGVRRDRHLGGPAGIAYATVHLDARAKRYADVKSIAEVLRQYDGFAGVLAGDFGVISTRIDDQTDTYEWPADSSAKGTSHETVTFIFKYRETLPATP